MKYFYINRIMDAGAYSNHADVPFYFLPCLVSGLAYYVSLKRAPQMTAGLKAVYDEEFERTADANRERVSFRVKPAQAYIPQEVIWANVKNVVMDVIVAIAEHAVVDNVIVMTVNVKRRKNE